MSLKTDVPILQNPIFFTSPYFTNYYIAIHVYWIGTASNYIWGLLDYGLYIHYGGYLYFIGTYFKLIGKCTRYKSKYYNPKSDKDFKQASLTCYFLWNVFHNLLVTHKSFLYINPY